jgi:hypothetical protein
MADNGLLNPLKVTANFIASEALKESGICGLGQTPTGSDITAAINRLGLMLMEWERKRWLVYHLVTLGVTATGAMSYSIGPGGDFDTGVGSVRPAKLESAFLRQIQNSQPNQVDYPLEILQAREDYNKIALKSLSSFPSVIWLDSSWPLGNVYPWPVPQASIYEVFVSVMAQLPVTFLTTPGTPFDIPMEYYSAMLYNLALRLRSWRQLGSFPGDQLPSIAQSTLKTVRGANTQIGRLSLPNFNRNYLYNIFSDTVY